VAHDSIALVEHLFRRQAGQAAACYRTALTLARTDPEQRWLRSRLTHLV